MNAIDESPMAYKLIDRILNNVEDTINITYILKLVNNFKVK